MRFIRIGGQLVEVTDEVYAAYFKSIRQERYFEHDIKVGRIVVDMKKHKVTFIQGRTPGND